MNNELLDTFKQNLTLLSQMPLEKVTRTNELGTEMDFSLLSSQFLYVQKIASRALQIDYSLLNDTKLKQITQVFDQVIAILNQIAKFKVTDANNQGDPIQRRDRMIVTCKDSINAFSEIILPYLSLINDDVKMGSSIK